MDRFRLGHSTATPWQQAADECLAQIGAIPADANLGFIYATDQLATEFGAILRHLKAHTRIEHWTGTLGVAICCSGTEYYDQPALAVLIAGFPDGSFRMLNVPGPSAANDTRSRDNGVQVALVHGDPRNHQLADIIERMPAQLGNGFLVGGLTSSRSYHYQVADEITEGQLSGVIFDSRVPVVSGLTQGCSVIGEVHTVTECDRNVAIRIDERPALDVFNDEIGEVLARDLERIAGYIFAGFPVRGTDTGDYLVRPITGIDADRRLLAVGDLLSAGQSIVFCRRDSDTAVTDLRRMLDSVKGRLDGVPHGGIYFTCLGRGQQMFGTPSREMQYIAEVLGDVPLVGFYANGEISGNQLYGYTGVLTLFQ
ncbi:MAG: FIST C-terminal domain-containing protein [Pseudomonadota bacterium]|nr:MAG: FIST C-terminal domain-containing protein [Pseudomonadota bacterium]